MSPTGFRNNPFPAGRATALVLGLTFCLAATPASSFGKTFKKNTVLMGTDIELIASDTDETKVHAAFDAAIGEMARIENVMSEWKEETPVSMINRMAGRKAVTVPDELLHVIVAGQTISELSGGAFDISWAAMRGLWKFSKGDEKIPTPDEIRKTQPLINYRDIQLDQTRKTVFLKKPGMGIGLGGIAKGYAVDKAMQVMVNAGIKNAVIKAGGDMRIQGTEDGKPWAIGIQHPRDKTKLLGTLALTNISLSTSGDYERFFIKDGILYHHIIDPKTGYPARGCRSVSILAPDTMTSDALSTAVFVLGPEKGMTLIKSLPGIEGIIVDDEGHSHYSPGIERTFRNGK
ncbi:MAG: FAD:protein FMN transferase [Nitrospirae bacterium]|nr:FAD:protein FMN transferase [Nitrospirota bacterium]